MRPKSEILKLWKCPKCGRQFERKGQAHSCRHFPIEQHFEGNRTGKILYEKFKRAVTKQLGSFKIESLECCIHFVSNFTFAAVKILRDKIRVDFTLTHQLKGNRIKQFLQISANRYLYYVDISTEDEIDKKLLDWIKEAHDKKITEKV